MSKITIYEVQERMPRMETLVELWEASVRATHHFHLLQQHPFVSVYQEYPQEQVRWKHLIAAI